MAGSFWHMEKIKLEFNDIIKRIKEIDLGEIDLVVAIGRGGIIPGALVANIFKKDFADLSVIAMFWPWSDGTHTTLKVALLKK